jgi:hypothetical protein
MLSSKKSTTFLLAITLQTILFSSCQNTQSLFSTGTGLGFFVVLAVLVVIVFFIYKFKKYKKP